MQMTRLLMTFYAAHDSICTERMGEGDYWNTMEMETHYARFQQGWKQMLRDSSAKIMRDSYKTEDTFCCSSASPATTVICQQIPMATKSLATAYIFTN